MTDKTGAAYLTSAFWGAFTAARLASVALAARLKPVQLLFGSLTGTMISLLIIILQPASFNALLVGTIGIGAFTASVFPTTLSFSERRMVMTGKVTSWFFIAAGIGGMTCPWLMGQFIESDPGFLMVILFSTIGLALLVLLWICYWLKPKLISQRIG